MAYENQCGSCNNLRNIKDDYKLYDRNDTCRGHCIIHKTCPYPDEPICSYYVKRTDEETACYITTIVCGLLGYDDDCSLLQTLRGFRTNIMQKDPKYKEILFEYDTVGRQISNLLMRDFFKPKEKEPDEFIVSLYNFYLQPTARLVTEKKYEEAVERYTKMTKSLEDYYSINVGQTVPQDYDYSQGGHGLYKKIGPGPLI